MENLDVSTVRVQQLNFYRTFWLMFCPTYHCSCRGELRGGDELLGNSTTITCLDDGMVRLSCEFESWEPRVLAGGRQMILRLLLDVQYTGHLISFSLSV